MKAITLLFVLGLMITGMINGQTPPLEAGVSQSLAKWRAAHYSDVRYKLNLTLEKGAPLMRGDIEIRVKLTDEGAKNDLILDWRTTQFANDKDKPFADVVAVNDAAEILTSQPNEHIRIPKALLKIGENFIKINFASPIKTSGAAITRYVDKEDGAEYIYSLFVPSDASTAFPVFDQPDLKAKFKLLVKAPADWAVLSNSRSFSNPSADCPASLNRRNCPKDFDFKETQPISTYVFAFAAGEFNTYNECLLQESKNPMCLPIPISQIDNFSDWEKGFGPNIYVRKSQAEKFKQHAAEVFRLNREGVKFLESYFDYKFPFPKYDLVLIPEFPFGGMEHAGATFLRESSVIFPTEPTKNDYVSRANVIFHEAAHQWFGDTVTMKWFDDLWLKEGFAEFMAYKTLEKVMPEYNAWKIFYERNKQAAYLTDSTKGTTPIYQEIPNLSAAKSAYGNIVYRKAPSFLKQAEFYLGEKEFQTAVRAFLKKHEFANAEWKDLVGEFETASGRDLEIWGKNWVTFRGMTKVKITPYLAKPKNIPSCYGEQQNVLKEKGWWTMSFRVLHIKKNGERVVIPCTINKTNLDALRTDFERRSPNDSTLTPREVFDKISLQKSEAFIPNFQDFGYGVFLLDKESRAYVLANIQNEKDDFLRTMMWGSLWDSVREAELAPRDYVELVIKKLNVETDESTIQTLLGRTSTAMNYYLSDKQRDEFAAQIETLLIDKMQNAPTVGQKITFYRAFLNTASSEKARNVLKDVLSGKFGIEGLNRRGDGLSSPDERKARTNSVNSTSNERERTGEDKPSPLQSLLKSKDKFDIVTKLLILGDKDAPALLAELEKTETSDEAKRYAYAAKAGIASAENKAKFYNDFVANKEISESWIEAAFAPFNSIRHSDLTLPYLEKALAELPNLKKNRKIFFVNGWLGAFIGGQKSAEALGIVSKFLESNPNLDRDLRLKILENVDGLERAVKIRAKYGKN